jgi:hypothetical protein
LILPYNDTQAGGNPKQPLIITCNVPAIQDANSSVSIYIYKNKTAGYLVQALITFAGYEAALGSDGTQQMGATAFGSLDSRMIQITIPKALCSHAGNYT